MMADRCRYRSFRGHYAKYSIIRLVHGVSAYGGEVGDSRVYGIIDDAFEWSDAMNFHGYATTAVETPEVSLSAQLGLAPSQIIPVSVATMFLMVATTWS